MRRTLRNTFNRLNQMLDDAINGQFEEGTYDETELSKLEVKWKRFLMASKLSNEKIEEERKNIKELVSDISHQTKTPLANIMLYSQLLQEQNLGEESQKLVTEIIQQSQKLEFLIQSLVKTSRLEVGTFQLTPTVQNVSIMVKEVIAQGKQKAANKEIEVLYEGDEKTVNALYDRKWTGEALYNILDNGIKYSQKGSYINIRIKEYEMFVCIQIQDEGTGLTEDEIPMVFQRFYRGENVRDEEGVGLGLYLARQIVEEQGGYIKVSSKNGEGSVFGIYLPKEQRIFSL